MTQLWEEVGWWVFISRIFFNVDSKHSPAAPWTFCGFVPSQRTSEVSKIIVLFDDGTFQEM